VQCMSAGGSDGSPDEAGASVSPGCRRAASLDDVGPGVQACQVGRELVMCSNATGGCAWVSDDGGGLCSAAVLERTPTPGTTCKNGCGPNEYALACGGFYVPPQPGPGQPQATPEPPSYQQAPTECRLAGSSLNEYALYCCPCE
jgi:hypothetical protein